LAKHIHILGICGTFMGSLALLARAKGLRVTGCDLAVYPPMSTQLQESGIELIEGYDPSQLSLGADTYIVGNAIARGNPLLEAILNRGLSYTSGPQWLAENVLSGRWVLAVAGTHGKTTTTSLLAWILEYAGMAPGFLIGGVACNFPQSARLGESDFFVIEADEYDTAFFDKRSKFLHYRPRTLILNNLEYDHADIFPDLAAIQTQFHHLVRTVPEQALIVHPQDDDAIHTVLKRGCWTPLQSSGTPTADWYAEKLSDDASRFRIALRQDWVAELSWNLSGDHNLQNALHAIAAARHVGVAPQLAAEALQNFSGVKRRLELVGEVGSCRVYDDFAHHPTAIESTLQGLRRRVGGDQIFAVIEPRSNTMKLGVHRETLSASVSAADATFWFQPPNLNWDFAASVRSPHSQVFAEQATLLAALKARLSGRPCHIVVMSNGGFDGMAGKVLAMCKSTL